MKYPLAVRSSSLLEDSHYQPFTGVYETFMLGNQQEDVHVRLERLTTMNLEFDFKRRPVNPRMVAFSGGEHLAFDTAPWPNLMEAELARNLFDKWREKRCLKTLADWDDWQDFYLSHRALTVTRRAGKAHGLQVTKEGSVGILQRVFGRGRTLKFPPSPRVRSVPESENLATPRFSLLIWESGFDGAGGEEKAGQDQWPACFVWTEDGPGEVEIVDHH